MGPTSPTAVAVNLLQVRTVIADLTAILWHGNTGLPHDVFRSTTTLQVLGSILSICLGGLCKNLLEEVQADSSPEG